jgi:hypothetical protein
MMAGIPMQSIATTDDNVRINMPHQSLSESKNIILQGICTNLSVFAPSPLKGYGKHRTYVHKSNWAAWPFKIVKTLDSFLIYLFLFSKNIDFFEP